MSVVSDIFKRELPLSTSSFSHLFIISFVLYFTKVLVYNGVKNLKKREKDPDFYLREAVLGRMGWCELSLDPELPMRRLLQYFSQARDLKSLNRHGKRRRG